MLFCAVRLCYGSFISNEEAFCDFFAVGDIPKRFRVPPLIPENVSFQSWGLEDTRRPLSILKNIRFALNIERLTGCPVPGVLRPPNPRF